MSYAVPSFRPLLATLLALVIAAIDTRAQDDLRDVITRIDGKTFNGRLLTPHAANELVLMQGGKRVRLQRADVRSTDLVADRVAEFCSRRLQLKASVKAQWFLAEWAESHGLPGLARAQAMLLALEHDFDRAHEFLGHEPGKKGRLWQRDGRALTREQFEASLVDKPLDIVGERFVVRCEGGLPQAIAALLDLEHMAGVFHATFGKAMQLQETRQPMLVVCSRNGDTFPKWGFRPLPYYTPAPHGDIARTFYAGSAPVRPQRLFFVGTQILLYHALIGEVTTTDSRDRVSAWLETGLGMYMENMMQGPPGFAAPGKPQAQDLLAVQALGQNFRLSQLPHLPMYGGFYMLDDTATAVHWGVSTMLIAWLLSPDIDQKTREQFLEFVRQALGERKGDSGSTFERIMGRRIDDLETPWRQWLAKLAGH